MHFLDGPTNFLTANIFVDQGTRQEKLVEIAPAAGHENCPTPCFCSWDLYNFSRLGLVISGIMSGSLEKLVDNGVLPASPSGDETRAFAHAAFDIAA